MSAMLACCGCMRYPGIPCTNRTELLLCPECITARCAVAHMDGQDGKEHLCVDNLVLAHNQDEV